MGRMIKVISIMKDVSRHSGRCEMSINEKKVKLVKEVTTKNQLVYFEVTCNSNSNQVLNAPSLSISI